MTTLNKLIRDEDGATAIEYGLIAALIAVAATVANAFDLADLRAQLDIATGGLGQHFGIAAGDLHRAWLGFVGMGHA